MMTGRRGDHPNHLPTQITHSKSYSRFLLIDKERKAFINSLQRLEVTNWSLFDALRDLDKNPASGKTVNMDNYKAYRKHHYTNNIQGAILFSFSNSSREGRFQG